ncbi:MAG TPA: 50S ribosomal protein L20 [Candidatus Fermentibacter daniensis]|jgi:large subunit ribosomal protein L20|nr:MAG: 50S ribosomal protein L20 [Candidatus Fermentibacter daniensis]MBP7719910.1 50S ribosomal protein L20 [Candidatus Fermentibacter sp.]OQC70206.1 MAG: 50S ribosomal protein L20 [candidate division Hyd24-12 bacterium ADurb.Bin004]KZD18057.1 MAG: 50S ribosomal protein L20 [Candidatus Fermentibacter daniensis]KZD19265.1 MAG: 50S ribosomal protein L20 [Candidatus Fermentibacter daniensis]
MTRVTSAVTRKQRHKSRLNAAKGYVGGRRKLYTVAAEAGKRALLYQYRDRRNRKRDFRALWIIRINAAARLNGMTYSSLINGLAKAGIGLDRKSLSDIAVNDPAAFARIAETARAAL